MALDYRSVRDIYDQLHDAGVTTQSLPDWSQEMNRVTGSNLYDAGIHDNIVKRASVGLDRLLESTGIPSLTAQAGRKVGEAFGAPETGEAVGQGLPRTFVNFLPLLIPAGGVAGAAARYGLTGLLSGAQTYTETGSPVSGLVSGATAAVLPKVANMFEQAALERLGGRLVEGPIADKAGNVISQLKEYFPETIPQRIGGAVAGQVGAAGVVGASQEAESLLRGEGPVNPFTVDNLLGLTMGQAPFAALHLGGRALGFRGKSPIQRADEAQAAVDASKQLIDLRTGLDAAKEKSPLETGPATAPPTETPPAVLAEIRNRLAQVRGEQIAVQADDSLDPAVKLDRINSLLQEETLLAKNNQPTGATILGNSITEESPRTEVVGKQLRTNKDGTWRAVLVSDDPFNPEDLRGKVVSYSTAYEPAPVFGLQTLETGSGRFSLPDLAQWGKVKPLEEWNSKYKTKIQPGGTTPDLPTQIEPLSDDEVSAHLHELQKAAVAATTAQTPADMQKALVAANDVALEANQPAINDTTLRDQADVIEKSGLVDPSQVTKAAAVVQIKKTAQRIATLPQGQTVENIHARLDEIKGVQTELDRQIEATPPEELAPLQQQRTALETERASLLNQLTGVVGRRREVTGARAEEQAAAALAPEEAGRVAGAMGAAGFSVRTLDKLSHGVGDNLESTPVKDIVTENAISAIRRTGDAATQAFNTWSGREDTTLTKDAADFMDLTGKYVSLNNVKPEEAAKYLSERKGTTWDADDVKDFINRPHVKIWEQELENQTRQQEQTNEAPIPAPILQVAGRKGQLLRNEDVNNVVESFSKGQNVVDAFGGSGQLAQFAKGAGANTVTLNVREPRMRAVFDEVKTNPDDFANRVATAVAPIKSSRDLSTPVMEDGSPVKPYLDELEKSDPNVALFVKQNLNAQGREVTAGAFTPTKVMATSGLQDLPNRIRNFSSQIDNLTSENGWDIVGRAGPDERVTVDPPYVGQRAGQYAGAENVTPESRLQDYEKYLYPAAERGAKFVVFDSANPELMDSLQEHGFTVQEVQRTSRGGAAVEPELVAYNHPEATEAPAPGTVMRKDAPIWQPEDPADVATMNKMGIPQGGAGMVNYLVNHPNPIFSAIGQDLSKFTDSLQRVTGSMRDIDSGGYTTSLPNGNFEIRLSPAVLRASDFEQGRHVAHELIHGISLSELNNPAKADVTLDLEQMRRRLTNALPEPMKKATNAAIDGNWLRSYGTRATDFNSLYPDGTADQRQIMYGLLNTRELVSQGLSEPAMRNFLMSQKTEGGGWFSRFSNLVKRLTGIGRVEDTAFEEFLSHTDRLLENSDTVASFRNFSDRYFQNLGMSDNIVRNNTQRAMATILDSPTDHKDLIDRIYMGAGSVRSPEWSAAQRDAIRMFQDREGDDAMATSDRLAEMGHSSDISGLIDMAHTAMKGDSPDFDYAVDLLPPTAQKLVFETAKDTKNILSVIKAAASEGNKGAVNLADPEFLRGTVEKALSTVDRITASEQAQKDAVNTVRNSQLIQPDVFFDVNSGDNAPIADIGVGAGKTTEERIGFLKKYFGTIAQLGRSDPVLAEWAHSGYALAQRARDIHNNITKVLGVDINSPNKNLSQAGLNESLRVTQPKLLDALQKWTAADQLVAKKENRGVTMLSTSHPEIAKVLDKLSPEERQIVIDSRSKTAIMNQVYQAEDMRGKRTASDLIGARIVMKDKGTRPADAVDLANKMFDAVNIDAKDPQQVQTSDATMRALQSQLSPEGFLDLLKFTQNSVNQYKLWNDYYQDNPAYAPAQRMERWLVRYLKNNKPILDQGSSRKEVMEKARGYKIIDEPWDQYTGNEDVYVPPSLSEETFNRLKELEENQLSILKSTLDPTQLESVKNSQVSTQFAREQAARVGAIPDFKTPPRLLTQIPENMPWLWNQLSASERLSNYWSRRLFSLQTDLHLADPALQSRPDLLNLIEQHRNNTLTPDPRSIREVNKFTTLWYMTSLASPIINGFQTLQNAVPEMTRINGGKMIDSYRRLLSTVADVTKTNGIFRGAKTPDHQWLEHQAIRAGEIGFSMWDEDAATQDTIATRWKQMLSKDKVQTMGQRMSNALGGLTNAGLWLFKQVEQFNRRVSLQMAFDRAREVGMSREDALKEAFSFNRAVNFGGGSVNRPIGAFAGLPRSVALTGMNLQSYNLGTISQLSRYLQDGYFRPNLKPNEIYAARKAGVQMLGTTLAAAGALGMPFVSASLALLNQAFPGLEVNKKFREGINTLLGEDEQHHALADIALTGLPSMLGWDMQSRLSLGTPIPGVSEFNGFEPEQLLGPPVGLISNYYNGLNRVAQGDPKGGLNFVPPGVKKLFSYLVSGGRLKDYRDRPIATPSPGEVLGITLGFQPKRLSDFNAADRMARLSQSNVSRAEQQFHQQQAEEVMKGNFGNVRQALLARAKENADYDPVTAVRSISSAAEQMTFPRDLRREGTTLATGPRERLLATFNLPPSQADEATRLQFRHQIEQRLGLATRSSRDLLTAQVVDQLRRQQPDATRADLRQQATRLLRAPRTRTLAEPQE